MPAFNSATTPAKHFSATCCDPYAKVTIISKAICCATIRLISVVAHPALPDLS
jgi:hypothetical protein